MMTILVTGANGMIGSHLVKELLTAGYGVVGIDRRKSSFHENNYFHYEVDLMDREGLQKISDEHKLDRVIHLAALAHTAGEVDLSWGQYYRINVQCAQNVFEVFGKCPLLYISTVDVFGFYDGQEPVTCNSPVHPVSKYGKSKAQAEAECQKLPCYTIFRFSPVYTDTVKRDIQKRYYLLYPNIAYQIGDGAEFEILNIKNAVTAMLEWCNSLPRNEIQIIKDAKNMWTPDYIKEEKQNGRAKIVLYVPRWLAKLGYRILKQLFGENEKTYLLNKALYPIKSI